MPSILLGGLGNGWPTTSLARIPRQVTHRAPTATTASAPARYDVRGLTARAPGSDWLGLRCRGREGSCTRAGKRILGVLGVAGDMGPSYNGASRVVY